MALPFFESFMNAGMIPDPDTMYRDLQQAFITDQWDNTTALYTVGEQADMQHLVFQDIQAWLAYVVDSSSSGRKNGEDFRQLVFEDITHPCTRGRYYQFFDNYWIAYFTDEIASVVKNLLLRRCNNFMRIVDPDNGSVFSIPCVVDYDMTSPSVQVTSQILTPNNHATVMVQGNPDTLRLFKTNTRYILGNRPFKLYGMQNTINDDYTSPMPTLIYLDLYLDELRANDNLELQLADNGTYEYTISINSQNMELTKNSTGQLTADIALNGQEVDNKTALWSSNDESVVTIDSNGVYDVIGDVGTGAIITATLQGNPDVVDSIEITVVDVAELTTDIIVDPSFTKIREYETVNFTVSASHGGIEISPTDTQVSLASGSVVLSNQYLTITKNDNQYTLTCTQRTNTPQALYITVDNTSPAFVADTAFVVHCVSMMG